VLHTTGGYLVFAAMTHQYVFDYHDGDIYCAPPTSAGSPATATFSTGRSANGATTLMFEGVPNYPDNSRSERHRQAQGQYLLHRADRDPRADAVRRRAGEEDLAQERGLLGSVGEPIIRKPGVVSPRGRRGPLPIVDTWWQTETGGILITAAARRDQAETRSATTPFFGVVPEIVDADGKVLEGETSGNLCIARSWPGPDAHGLWRSRPLRADLLFDLQGQVFYRRRLPS